MITNLLQATNTFVYARCFCSDNASSYCTTFGSKCDKTLQKSCSLPLFAFILFASRILKQLIKANVVKLVRGKQMT